jgi:hypothetical protein
MLNAMICLLDGWNPSTGRHRCNRNGKVGENKWNNERRKRINRHLPARHLAASVIADEAVAGRKLTLILSRYSRQANNRTNQRDSAHVVGIAFADGKLLPSAKHVCAERYALVWKVPPNTTQRVNLAQTRHHPH